MSEIVIKTRNLSKQYGRGIKALDDFDIKVYKGEVYSLLGPNGAGKTTLMKLLLTLVNPTSGIASINGLPISDPQSRISVGYLSEKHAFPGFLTPEKVLKFYGAMTGKDSNYIESRVGMLLDLVGLSKNSTMKIRKFSKGMLQRLGIAQALIGDPDLLFLDEPTDGIDPVGRKEIRDIIFHLKERGKTVFINSHLLSEVEKISDRIAILKNGKKIREGSVGEFVNVEDSYIINTDGDKKIIIDLVNTIDNLSYDGESVLSGSLESINELIDKLRQNRVNIKELSPRKISLEDYFIKTIEV
ncbi:MAG: ABC transporter ATP-binding protein [Candidatus Delongbacteria bacterium]|nr:ABC transporter ATP-binding protein [Candidatus Delongbacteria bacterium]MBN2834761.1 ABC transporter ATP-binding protein [Candidatus Delongbacteria bacterium]